jgi:hypothetical protein
MGRIINLGSITDNKFNPMYKFHRFWYDPTDEAYGRKTMHATLDNIYETVNRTQLSMILRLQIAQSFLNDGFNPGCNPNVLSNKQFKNAYDKL